MDEPLDDRTIPWEEIHDLERFRSKEWTRRIDEGLSVYRPGTTDVDPERLARVVGVLETFSGQPIRRLQALEKHLNELFVEKTDLIRMILVCAIAHQPMLLVGPPGTAKSMLVLKFCEALGIGRIGEAAGEQSVFQYLLHGFTEPDEVLGIINIRELRTKFPRFRRIPEGSITEADVVFLDEVFRANSAILNALLTVMNERQVYEGGILRAARARVIYGASNSPPPPQKLDDLRAFYERFIVRMESIPIPIAYDAPLKTDSRQQFPAAPKVRQDLLARAWSNEVRSLRAGYVPARAALAPVSCLNDIVFLNRAVTELWGGSEIGKLSILPYYHALVAEIAGGRAPMCDIDDRKFVRLFLVVRAHSLLRANTPPEVEDLTVLKHVWRDKEESKGKLETAVTGFIGRYAGKSGQARAS